MTAETFDFNTSGAVYLPDAPRYARVGEVRWSDLPNDFVRGYIRAAFGSGCEGCPPRGYPTDETRCVPCIRVRGFRHLHPDTLASMLADCERFLADPRCKDRAAMGAENGGAFWTLRQLGAGESHGFPKLHLCLNEAGQVCTAPEADGGAR